MSRNEVLNVLKEFKKDTKDKYHFIKLGIFGSQARDLANDNSDIDIVIETLLPDLFQIVHIKEELEDRLGKNVDIIRYREHMNKFLKNRIDKEAQYV